MKIRIVVVAALALTACGGPESKGESCYFDHGSSQCVQRCMNTYKDPEDANACMDGVRDAEKREKRNNERFGRD